MLSPFWLIFRRSEKRESQTIANGRGDTHAGSGSSFLSYPSSIPSSLPHALLSRFCPMARIVSTANPFMFFPRAIDISSSSSIHHLHSATQIYPVKSAQIYPSERSDLSLILPPSLLGLPDWRIRLFISFCTHWSEHTLNIEDPTCSFWQH